MQATLHSAPDLRRWTIEMKWIATIGMLSVCLVLASCAQTQVAKRSPEALAEMKRLSPELVAKRLSDQTARTCLRAWEAALVA